MLRLAPESPETPPDVAEIELFIDEHELQSRIGELAQEIAADYRNLGVTPRHPLHLVGVLKGVVPFMADLMRAIPTDVPTAVDFMAITSYGPSTRQVTGGARILKDLEDDIEGRHVLIVEDIVDTGLTLAYVLKHLRAKRPLSLRCCALLDRSSVRLIDSNLHYVGFEIPDQFVVGYGLDFDERHRNLSYIGVLKR